MANELYSPDFLGYGILQKTAGTAANPSVGTEWVFPFARISPYNVLGNAYPAVVNSSAYPSVSYVGKKRPGFTITTYLKSGIITADLLNACLFNLTATPSRTDLFSFKVSDSITAKVWDWARCTSIILTAGASGGPCILNMSFLSRWGETDCPYSSTLADGEVIAAAPTFSTPTASGQSGSLASIMDYDFRSDSGLGTASGGTWTATQVSGFTLHLIRAQGYVDFIDGGVSATSSSAAKEIATGAFTGGLSLDQGPNTTSVPTTGATLRLNTNAGADLGIKIAMLLKKDSKDRIYQPSLGSQTNNYTLIDPSGGNPATVTKYTPT